MTANRDIEAAGKLLASGTLDDRATTIALARVRYPHMTWGQIAIRTGMGRTAALSLFRRRCAEAGLR